MNKTKLDSAVSPSRAGNFVISYTQEVEIVKNIQTDSLIQFLDSEQTSSTSILCETDKSFFPRAFTDTDLIEQEVTAGESLYVHKESSSGKRKGLEGKTMAVQGNGRFGSGAFQPDVITSNSHQRSGPDGSPALAPARSQGFSAPTNLSETGELFAPVRTLTFSDIDQSSQIEDGYVNNSRLVSTPSKSERVTSYDYNSIYNSQSRNVENEEDIQAEYSDSSDSDIIDRMRGSESPVFRQLEGEADNDLMKTGPFHPSAHGLSKEFMDNFVGKTGNQAAMRDKGDIFSPLGSNPYAERQIHSVTPPLHSPGPNSPYAKRYNSPRNKKSPRMERSPRGRPSPKGEAEPREDHDEIQFAMSPTKNQPDIHPFDEDMLELGNQNVYKQDYCGQEKFYFGKQSSEHSFVPIEKQPHTFNPASVPKNLNEYFEQVTSDEFLMSRNKQTNSHEEYEENEINNRQGDGTDSNVDDSHHRHCSSPDHDNQFSVVSPSSFEQRYLQKTQVSVKLPQATYDTISANTSHNEKFASGDHAHHDRNETSDFPPDVAAGDAEYRPVAANSAKSSPGKVMDLLQNQVSKLKDMPEEANDGSRDRVEKKYENLGNSHMSAKSKDTNNINFKPNTAIKNSQQTDVSQHDNTSGSDKTGQSGKHQVMMSQSLASNEPKQNNVNVKQSESFQAGGQSQLPVTSRLLQETVSQRNKTTQKFVSSAPCMTKPVTNNQNKEFKKPYDVCPKNQNLACSGARKTLPNENGAKFKVSDKTKTKSVSTESLNSKQRTVQNHSKNVNVGNSQEKMSQSRYLTQSKNQSAPSQSQGNSTRGQQLQNSKGQAMADGHNGSMHSVEDEGQGHGHIVTQVETTSPVPVEQPRQNIRCRQGTGIGDSSLDIKGMEEVRQQLQGMMRLSYDNLSAQDRTQYEHSDILAGFGVDFGDQHRSFENSWNFMRKPGEDDMMENFPSFTSQYFTDSGNLSRSDASVHAENQRLRDMLEKERYRRKHCEQYIQQLNVKLLEAQQQLAVAVSTDKRKDIMIEQLDKQLARVMEGWKKRDLEKDAFVEEMQKEKEEIENNLKQQQEMISNFEHDMSAAVDALRQEKERAAQHAEELKEKIDESERAKNHAEELLDAEKEKVDLMQQECDNLREARENLDKKLDQMQRRLHREQDDWFQREQELLQRIEEVSEKSNKILQAERAKNEEQGKLAEEIMDQYQAANTAVKKLEMELDAALREKESLKVEMGIMEAKFENAQRVLEADMHSTMEKQITEQIADVQKRHEKSQDELREKHREQMLELSKKNGKEMERQLSGFRDEMHKKEEDFRKQLNELESRLMEYRNENAELKRSKQKLESARLEILTKLQYAMQTQWNEALTLLSATPQRQQSQSRTLAAEENKASVVSAQAVSSVNFSLCTPNKLPTNQNSSFMPVTNQDTPPRGAANQTTPPRQSANQQSPSRSEASELSPVLRPVTQYGRVATYSPGGDSLVSHSTEKDPGEVTEATIETAAMSHLKQFQDYMNSFTKTPEWISTINSQQESTSLSHTSQLSGNPDQWAHPRLPSPPELAALLTTHLHNIQQQHLMPHPPVTVNQSEMSFSQPNSILASQKHPVSSASSSLPPNLNFGTSRSHNVSSTSHNSGSVQAPYIHPQSEFSQMNSSVMSERNSGNFSMLSEKGNGTLWEGASGMSRAVPLLPPQQGDDPYTRGEQQTKMAGFPTSHVRGYFQGGQSFSPPTKQNKDTDSLEDESVRLNEDYSQLSERLQQHESHQQELQHYIQMLLHRSPGEVTNTDQNDSVFSQDNVELDLNDTAQAAQLQRELDRIQELRQKQESSNRQKGTLECHPGLETTLQTQAKNDQSPNKILNQEQLAEVTKLLNQVKGQGQSQSVNPQVTELLELLKHAQVNNGNHSEPKKGNRAAAGQHSDRHKGPSVGIRRNVQFNPGKGIDSTKTHPDGNKFDKSAPKSNQQKKVERKVAGSTAEKKSTGSATKGEKGVKPVVWK